MLHPGTKATGVVLSQGMHGPNEPTPRGGELPVGQKADKLTTTPQSAWGAARGPALAPPEPQAVAPIYPILRPRDGARGCPGLPSQQGLSGAEGNFYQGPGLTHAGPTHQIPRQQRRTPHASEMLPGARTTGRNPPNLSYDRHDLLLTAGKDG